MSQLCCRNEALALAIESLERLFEIRERASIFLSGDALIDGQELL